MTTGPRARPGVPDACRFQRVPGGTITPRAAEGQRRMTWAPQQRRACGSARVLAPEVIMGGTCPACGRAARPDRACCEEAPGGPSQAGDPFSVEEFLDQEPEVRRPRPSLGLVPPPPPA